MDWWPTPFPSLSGIREITLGVAISRIVHSRFCSTTRTQSGGGRTYPSSASVPLSLRGRAVHQKWKLDEAQAHPQKASSNKGCPIPCDYQLRRQFTAISGKVLNVGLAAGNPQTSFRCSISCWYAQPVF